MEEDRGEQKGKDLGREEHIPSIWSREGESKLWIRCNRNPDPRQTVSIWCHNSSSNHRDAAVVLFSLLLLHEHIQFDSFDCFLFSFPVCRCRMFGPVGVICCCSKHEGE